MARLSPSRSAALKIVSEQRRRGAYLREIIRTSNVLAVLNPQERAHAVRLALGAVSSSGELDRVITSHVTHATHMQPKAGDAFRIAAYELLYMATPQEAAVSQGVELVKSTAPWLTSLANAVLHRIALEDRPRLQALRNSLDHTEISANVLAELGAIPEWLAAYLLSSLGPTQASRLALSLHEAVPLYIASNNACLGSDEAFRLLVDKGLAPEASQCDSSFLLNEPALLASSGLVGDLRVVVADLSAQAIAAIAAPEENTSILEIGQGRGTKTLLMANVLASANKKAEFVSLDVNPSKVERTSLRISQAGYSSSFTSLAFDGRCLNTSTLPQELSRSFDTVFVDAPCSGTGTLRRHPELAWTRNETSLDPHKMDSLPSLQQALIASAATRVAKGGSLIYSTCSALEIENTCCVEAFLASELGSCFELVPVITAPSLSYLPKTASFVEKNMTKEGFFRTNIVPFGPDVHFAARLVRNR